MIKIQESLEINALPDEVWSIVGDLSRAPEFTPTIVSARVDGLNRFCTDESGNEIHEEMGDYSVELRRYSWRHIKSPLPVKSSSGWYFVRENGKTCEIQMVWELEFLDPTMELQITPNLERAARLTLENLKRLAEGRS